MNFDLNSPTRPVRNSRFETIGRNRPVESPAELSDLLEETALDETVIESLYPVADPDQFRDHIEHQSTLGNRTNSASSSANQTIRSERATQPTSQTSGIPEPEVINRIGSNTPRAIERVRSSGTIERRRSIRRSNQFKELEESLKNSENQEIDVRIGNFVTHSTSERMTHRSICQN